MNDLFIVAAPAPVARVASRRRATMPAHFLWPGDVLLRNNTSSPLTRVEVDGLTVRATAGDETITLDHDQVVEVLTDARL